MSPWSGIPDPAGPDLTVSTGGVWKYLCQISDQECSRTAGQEVISVVRQFQYCANSGCCDLFQLCAENCWCDDCCKHFALDVTVEAPPGQRIGHVRQRYRTHCKKTLV
ncbi:hypothetical protein HOLleu_45259 [Holothuria leucospilota]|uniref:Uncharacterized protein n=1 Tax=Holothuria leucospilota TaxID=206669 RepID=A0A9Q0Y9N4_HOLLE|nr:hypothetical protein HOLleu_45259 [Holothuria leucospilota]